MLPGVKFPSEEIVRAALALVREQGGIRSVSAPCILTHGVLNALSVFAPEPDYKTRCVIFRILIVLAAAYAAYLLRRLPPLTSGESCVRMKKNTEGD